MMGRRNSKAQTGPNGATVQTLQLLGAAAECDLPDFHDTSTDSYPLP
jgi:hypothetical protein